MSAPVSLLLIGLILQMNTGFSENITEFNCTSGAAIPIRSASTSGSIVSPCYPDSYTSSNPSCDLDLRNCFIQLPSLTDGTWLGLYNGDSNSTLYPGGVLRFYYYYSKSIFIPREWDFEEVAGRQFISSAAHINDNTRYYLTFRNQQTYSTVSPSYKFKVIYRYAHYIPLDRDKSVTAKAKGYVVSHSGFDHGTRSSYTANITSRKYKLTGLTTGKSVKLKFLYFKIDYILARWLIISACGDYLTISGVKGYTDDKLRFCGDEDPTTTDLDPLYPVGSEIGFQFTTRTRLQSSNINSTGFLIEYQVIDEICPPFVQNARVSLTTTRTIDGKAVYLITCDSGYRTINNSLAQTYVCGSQQPPLPCIETVCEKIPEGLADVPYLNISMIPPGRPVVNSTLAFSCNSTDYALVGDREALCSSGGVWILENNPQCLPTSTTSPSRATITECESLADFQQNTNLVISEPTGGRPVVGSVITFSCKSNYILTGDSQATCSPGGVWIVENAPGCTLDNTGTGTSTLVTECNSLADFQQGTNLVISEPAGGRPVVGSVITFSCKSNYILTGDHQATCSPDGVWIVENGPECLNVPAAFTTEASKQNVAEGMKKKSIVMYTSVAACSFVLLVLLIVIGIILIKRNKDRRRKQVKSNASQGAYTTTIQFTDDQHRYDVIDSTLLQPLSSSELQTNEEEVYVNQDRSGEKTVGRSPGVYVTDAYLPDQHSQSSDRYVNVDGRVSDATDDYYDYIQCGNQGR